MKKKIFTFLLAVSMSVSMIPSYAFAGEAGVSTPSVSDETAESQEAAAVYETADSQEVAAGYETADSQEAVTEENEAAVGEDVSEPETDLTEEAEPETGDASEAGEEDEISLFSVAASGSCGTKVTWSLSSGGTLNIKGSGAMANYDSDYDIPWYDLRSDIKKIVIAENVTSIGDSAFGYCENLTSVTIPSTVKKIGQFAFYECEALKSITIPSSVTSIDICAFSGTGLTSVTIPSSVKAINDMVFQSCASLTSVTIPSSVTSIGAYAFSYCTSLTGVTIPSSVTEIGDGAFEYTAITSIKIPSSVTEICEFTFDGCSSLTSVTIPSSVTTIGAYAFYECDALKSVRILSTVTSIGDCAFGYSDELTGIIILGDKNSAAYTYASENGLRFERYLSTPVLKSVSNVSTGVNLTWGAVSGAVKYRVYYSENASSWTRAGETTSASYVFTGLTSGKTYYFTVRCIPSDGKVFTSDYDHTGLSLTCLTSLTPVLSYAKTGIKVSWSKVTGAEGYYLYRKTEGGSYKRIYTVKSGSTVSYTDTGVTSGTTYIYVVKAYSGSSIGACTKSASRYYLSRPANVAAANQTSGVKISWDKVPGAYAYRVYRSVSGKNSYTKLKSTTKTYYTDTTAKAGTAYDYKIIAYIYDSTGSTVYSAYSDVITNTYTK